ncbi:large ribosomal subunit protein uL1m [Nothobranchius furzeri]|uniref:Large ribosomal subunit protein uL1m n=1 Tax=Nothobranchius furzeri TaxID=105023 RepID=A0A1A7ZTR9_NOTFU|nr:39S ribosomal protein L1, mitochondrial [Nothobranchius furzeri]KAF7205298.1 mitochondrial ribosomal protein L1 [Nothobranchius furzeri]
MATCSRAAWKALAGCRRQLLSSSAPGYAAASQTAPKSSPIRTFAAFKALKKRKSEDAKKEVKKEWRVIDDTGRHKPYGKTAWAPVDDVYIKKFYPRSVHSAASAIDMLKRFQELDFTPSNQPVYVNLKLDMQLEKKKKVDPFVSVVHLPHPFRTDPNKVLVFTEDPKQATAAQENGATIVGGAELVQLILDDEISADFYVATPEVLPKLILLKNKLRKKFPKSKRGTVGNNVPKMLALFRTGHEYLVVDECFVQTQVATLDQPGQHIFANLQTILTDVFSHRPAHMGPFVERAILTSKTSEAVWFHSQDVLPNVAQTDKE